MMQRSRMPAAARRVFFWLAFAVVPASVAKADVCEGRNVDTLQAVFECGLSNYLVEGPQRDAKAAATWFAKAAAQGNVDAATNLGQMYLDGDGMPQSDREGFLWLQKAAERGQPKAMYGLALLYESGRGSEVAYRKAAEWYERAAENGHAQSKNNLANMLRYGQGVPVDLRRAAKLYEDAAQQGNPSAAYNLAWMVYRGIGVDADPVDAYKWFFIARSLGAASLTILALEETTALERALSPAQLAEAENRLRAWRPRRPSDRGQAGSP